MIVKNYKKVDILKILYSVIHFTLLIMGYVMQIMITFESSDSHDPRVVTTLIG
jgi:hypothetical protein